ncbi:AAA family ATPase [Microbacterium sp. SSW1-47]|nr:AAA family ATPase [Microbacterium sufflavum]
MPAVAPTPTSTPAEIITPAPASASAQSPEPVASPAHASASASPRSPEPAESRAAGSADASAQNASAHAASSGRSRRRSPQRETTTRPSFLTEELPAEPARMGFRGALNRIGMDFGPGSVEEAFRRDEAAVSRQWSGPRTIAIVNSKGGAGKTPTTALLAAVFARFGGAGVLAWDNHQTRGTLGWRTESASHRNTLREMLSDSSRLISPGAQAADLADYVHHQPRDRFDVLRSQPPRLAHDDRLGPAEVDVLHTVASRFYRLIFVDSGNDETDPLWRRMIDHTDQLVVATTSRGDHAEAGALLLEALAERDERSAHLVEQAVVIVSQADPHATPTEIGAVSDGYRSLCREVHAIPFDREMVDGPLRYTALAGRTQRAWLSAAAAVARGL